jgi:hypothetical protein
MHQRLSVLVIAALLAVPPASGGPVGHAGAGVTRPTLFSAQTRTAPRPPARRPAPKPAPLPPLKTEPAMITCPNPLGEGVQTKRSFCDVLTGREPMDGILVDIPPHVGPATIMFDLHNRHMYSEELIKSNRAYRRYTATIGVLTMDNTLLSRAIIQSEFRTAGDLVDRIGGGAGPGGVKAVAPTGTESIAIEIPETDQRVSILGEKLAVERLDSATPDAFNLPGQPVAIISNVMLEYRPAPPKRTPPVRRR